MEAFKDKVPKSVWNHCLRARCAHFNALEGFPLFAAAMVRLLFTSSFIRTDAELQIAGTAAGLPTEDMNSSAAQYLGLRVLYTLYYIGVEDNFLALARTGVWGLSIAVPCWTLWKAGLKI
jgi:uncharacterized MAPEG superfamily protein